MASNIVPTLCAVYVCVDDDDDDDVSDFVYDCLNNRLNLL